MSGETNSTSTAPGAGRPALSIGDTARVLGVSTRTIRRWEKDGRIRAVRTEGGHRRFPVDVVLSLQGARSDAALEQQPPRLRRARLPQTSLPALARLLSTRGEAVIARSNRHIYSDHAPGWFRSAAGAGELKLFVSTLAAAAGTGDWRRVLPATSMLMRRAATSGRVSYQEAFLFLRTLRTILIAELRAQDPASPLEVSRLFEALEQEAVRNAASFFVPEQPARPDARAAEPVRLHPRAAAAALDACRALAAMSACQAALVLIGPPQRPQLELLAGAGCELLAQRTLELSDDPLSAALGASEPSFIRSTRAIARLPIRPPKGRCLPMVAATEVSGRLRVATVVLVRAGTDVESRMLAPLADLNRRLAAALTGSGEAGPQAELQLIAAHLD